MKLMVVSKGIIENEKKHRKTRRISSCKDFFLSQSNVNLVYSTYSKSGLDGVLQAETLC